MPTILIIPKLLLKADEILAMEGSSSGFISSKCYQSNHIRTVLVLFFFSSKEHQVKYVWPCHFVVLANNKLGSFVMGINYC